MAQGKAALLLSFNVLKEPLMRYWPFCFLFASIFTRNAASSSGHSWASSNINGKLLSWRKNSGSALILEKSLSFSKSKNLALGKTCLSSVDLPACLGPSSATQGNCVNRYSTEWWDAFFCLPLSKYPFQISRCKCICLPLSNPGFGISG